MWKVTVNLKGRDNEITEMTYLKKGDSFTAISNVMAAMETDAADPEWVSVQSIVIDKVEE